MRVCGVMTGALALLALAACDKPGQNDAGQESADQTGAASPATPTPAAAPVVTIPPPDIPADGKIHVLEQKGKFRIKPTMQFCQPRSAVAAKLKKIGVEGLGLYSEHLEPAFRKIGQSDYMDGTGRYGELHPKYCPDDGKNIIIEGTAGMNTTGTPYALVLSARQGPASAPTAVVRVAVARTESYYSTLRVWANGPEDAARLRLSAAIRQDGEQISRMLVSSIFAKGNK
jgi:hypothetical protein